MRKLLVALTFFIALALPQKAHAVCEQLGGPLFLENPVFGDRFDIWANCIRNNFIKMSTGTLTIGGIGDFSTFSWGAGLTRSTGSVFGGIDFSTAAQLNLPLTSDILFAINLSTSIQFLTPVTGIRWADGSFSTTTSSGDTFVTGKDLHDHLGGDGAQILHSSLGSIGTDDHHVPTVDTFVTNLDSHDHIGGDGAQIQHSSLGGIGIDDHHVKAVSSDIIHDATIGGTTDDAHFDHADSLAELNAQIVSALVSGAHTINTNAATLCDNGEFLNGDGTCDDANGWFNSYQGKATRATICGTTPSAAGNTMDSSDQNFQKYGSTAAVLGSWIGANGINACD